MRKYEPYCRSGTTKMITKLPRSCPFFPQLQSALFSGVQLPNPPSEIELNIDDSCAEHFSLYVSQLAALASGFDRAFCEELRHQSSEYLLETGESTILLDQARRILKIKVIQSETRIMTGGKRAGVDKKKSFEKRIESYCSIERFDVETLEEIKLCLQSLQFPSTPEEAGRLLPSGRREHSSARQLSEAIKIMKSPSRRSECNARFENLAAQIWGWVYPKLTSATRSEIINDFMTKQAEMSRSKRNASLCPNATIRMLWHFGQLGIEVDVDMYRVPLGADSWKRNMEILES